MKRWSRRQSRRFARRILNGDRGVACVRRLILHVSSETLLLLAGSPPARLALLRGVRVLEVLRPELEVLGALLVKLDRDQVLKVGEQLDDLLPVGFPGEKDPLGAQFQLALAEEALC